MTRQLARFYNFELFRQVENYAECKGGTPPEAFALAKLANGNGTIISKTLATIPVAALKTFEL
jgi:hypothetical protein